MFVASYGISIVGRLIRYRGTVRIWDPSYHVQQQRVSLDTLDTVKSYRVY